MCDQGGARPSTGSGRTGGGCSDYLLSTLCGRVWNGVSWRPCANHFPTPAKSALTCRMTQRRNPSARSRKSSARPLWPPYRRLPAFVPVPVRARRDGGMLCGRGGLSAGWRRPVLFPKPPRGWGVRARAPIACAAGPMRQGSPPHGMPPWPGGPVSGYRRGKSHPMICSPPLSRG